LGIIHDVKKRRGSPGPGKKKGFYKPTAKMEMEITKKRFNEID